MIETHSSNILWEHTRVSPSIGICDEVRFAAFLFMPGDLLQTTVFPHSPSIYQSGIDIYRQSKVSCFRHKFETWILHIAVQWAAFPTRYWSLIAQKSTTDGFYWKPHKWPLYFSSRTFLAHFLRIRLILHHWCVVLATPRGRMIACWTENPCPTSFHPGSHSSTIIFMICNAVLYSLSKYHPPHHFVTNLSKYDCYLRHTTAYAWKLL